MNAIFKKIANGVGISSLLLSMSVTPLLASSHGEAPLISMDRFADNTDTYAFRSVESGRAGYVTLLANWIPLQEPGGGPPRSPLQSRAPRAAAPSAEDMCWTRSTACRRTRC